MCSPFTALLPAEKAEMSKDTMIRLFLQEAAPGNIRVSVEINEQATVQNVISAYCAKRGVGYSSALVIFDTKKSKLPHFRTLQSLGITDGQTLYVGHEKKSTSMDRKWIFILTVTIIAIFVVAVVIMAAFYATTGGVVPLHFAVIMDGGSSKTNVLLYKWPGAKHKGTGCVIQEGSGCKVSGGIAVNNASYVLPCITDVKGHIKSPSVSDTPIYFASTAGMRILNMSDPNGMKKKLDEIKTVLNSTEMEVKKVEIISGQDEGKYAWITANFLKETLETEPQQNPWSPATIGALDMGGASAQIAYALEPTVNNSDPSVETVQLYGLKHDVFASSSLCFGRGEAENRHRALLVKDPKTLIDIIDPCVPKGHRYSVTGKKLFSEPCTNSTEFRKWLQDNPTLKDQKVTFLGSADYSTCAADVKRLVNTANCQSKGFMECFEKITKSVNNQKFLAFATYFYTTSGLNLTKSSLPEFITGTKEYCARTVDQIDKNNSFAADLCFNACYMHEVLVTGYGFTEETWSNIEFSGHVEEKEITWSLGYMIKATNLIPAKSPSPKFTSVGVFAACMVIFMFIAIAAAAFLAYNFGKKSSDNYSLQYA